MDGQLCNQSTLPARAAEEALNAHNDRLTFEVQHGFCTDPAIRTMEACEALGATWREHEGPTLVEKIKKANETMHRWAPRVHEAAAGYDESYSVFHKAYEAYAKEVQTWKSVLADFGDDYALNCRPYHDVTMQCEAKYRQAMRWWQAREPLPECEIGVTVPYTRNKTLGDSGAFSAFSALLSWFGSWFGAQHA